MKTESAARYATEIPNIAESVQRLQHATVRDCHGDGRVRHAACIHDDNYSPPPHHHGGSVDLPKVLHPVAMRGADREDAMKVTITRDGKVYFDTEQIRFGDLPAKIQDRLKGEVEHKVYVIADMRARWGGVRLALDGVRAAGIIRVAFLVNQQRIAYALTSAAKAESLSESYGTTEVVPFPDCAG
jgi:biopolymer transport protein ExbD